MISGMSWTLSAEPALARPDLLAASVAKALVIWPQAQDTESDQISDAIRVAPIDATFADTAAFCDTYGVRPEESVNCVIVAGKRDGELRYAACLILATTRADVNGVVRRHLGVRKASFAAMDAAVALTGMEYGGITPVGLPPQWPVLIDPRVTATQTVVIGSGVRHSKIIIPGYLLAALPHAHVIDGLAKPT